MRWLLDSNILIDAIAGLPHGTRVLRAAANRSDAWIGFSTITRIEVLGFPNLNQQEESAIRTLLNEFEEVPLSGAIAEQTILIRKSVRIKTPDAIIAASALVTKAAVITRNTGDFDRVTGLTVLHPDSL